MGKQPSKLPSKTPQDRKSLTTRKRDEANESMPNKQLKASPNSMPVSNSPPPSIPLISVDSVARSPQNQSNNVSIGTPTSTYLSRYRQPSPSSSISTYASRYQQPSPSSRPNNMPDNVQPILSLEDFGMEVDETDQLPPAAVADPEHALKCCVLFCKQKVVHIIFRCMAKQGYKVCWQEKLLNDAVENAMDWVAPLGIKSKFTWVHKGIKQMNGKNFGIRCYCINTKPIDFNVERITKLANTICQNLNAMNDNKPPMILPSNRLFWLPTDGSVVLSDVAATNDVLQVLMRKCGDPENNPTFYSTHSNYIHSCCFRRFQLTAEVADLIGAPSDQILQDPPDMAIDMPFDDGNIT